MRPSHSMIEKKKYNCRVTNYSPNPDGVGYGSNKPNTINLWESGWKN